MQELNHLADFSERKQVPVEHSSAICSAMLNGIFV